MAQSVRPRFRLNNNLLLLLIAAAGCSLMDLNCATTDSYVYRVVTENCNCTEYRTRDTKHQVDYLFRGSYGMSKGMLTTIDVGLTNRSNDTLSLALGTVRVSSRNIDYQYNDKFLPLPTLNIPPHQSESIHLTGRSIETKEDWNRIAGERLTVTLQGLQLGAVVLPAMTVTFIPENPKLRR
jgi:hypothetical protein